MSNASALFRSLLVYGICLPLAVFLGYLLANPMDFATVTVVVVVFAVLAIPLLLRWHHAWLIATWNTTAMLFFLPGKPQVWMGLAAASLADLHPAIHPQPKNEVLSAPSVARPLLFLTAVILLTARLTGGFGMRIMGGDTYGGKQYFMMFAAMPGILPLSTAAFPPKRAGLYVALFFLGAGSMADSESAGERSVRPSIFYLWSFRWRDVDAFTDQNSVVGQISLMSRTVGLAALGGAIYLRDAGPLWSAGGLGYAPSPGGLALFCFLSWWPC